MAQVEDEVRSAATAARCEKPFSHTHVGEALTTLTSRPNARCLDLTDDHLLTDGCLQLRRRNLHIRLTPG